MQRDDQTAANPPGSDPGEPNLRDSNSGDFGPGDSGPGDSGPGDFCPGDSGPGKLGAGRPSPALRVSLREFLGLVTIAALVVAIVVTIRRLHHVEEQLGQLRTEVGHLGPSAAGQIAAARAPSDQPLTYRIRVRVPKTPGYRVAYSSMLPQNSNAPNWYGAVKVPPGESLVTVRVGEDPRDDRWKITTLVGSQKGTRRMSTALPLQHVAAFQQTHDVVSTGIGRETSIMESGDSIRLLDERWLVGEGSLLLYGDRPPPSDQLGIYAELQPDNGPL